jgi:hypothetical protein
MKTALDRLIILATIILVLIFVISCAIIIAIAHGVPILEI